LDTNSLNSYAVTVGTDTVFAGGIFTVHGSSVMADGNWVYNSGQFNIGTSTVIFQGTSTSTIVGSNNFANLYCTTPGKELDFQAGATQSVSGSGTLTLIGDTGNLVTLRSTSSGTQWFLINTGGSNVLFVDVKDSNAGGGAPVVDTSGVDSHNNVNWVFGDLVPPAALTDLNAVTDPVAAGRIDLTWTAPGDDGVIGTLVAGSSFTIQGTTLTPPSFNPAAPPTGTFSINLATSGVRPGDLQAYTLTGLLGGATYYFRVWTRDENGNLSGISNGATTFAHPGKTWARSLSSIDPDWSNPSNWEPFGVPGSSDDVFFNSFSTQNCTINITTGIGNMTVESSYGFQSTIAALSTITFVLNGSFDQEFGIFNLQGSSMSVAGSWKEGFGPFIAGGSTVTFTGSGSNTVAIQGMGGGGDFGYVVFSGTGTWNLDSKLLADSDLTINAGTLDSHSNNFFTDNTIFVATNVYIHGGTLNLNGSNMTAGGNWTQAGGTVNADSSQMDMGGNWSQTSGTFNAGVSSVTFDGSGAFNITSGGSFASVQFDMPGSTWTLLNGMALTDNFLVSTGTVNTASSFAINAGGNVEIDPAGIFSLGSASVKVTGNWVKNGQFNAGTSLVTFIGPSFSTSTLTGSTTFYNLGCVTIGKSLFVAGGSTQTVDNLLTLTGGSGNLIVLRSTATNTQWYLNDVTANNVSFVDAEDSNASPGFTILAGTNSFDSGNNINWSFAAAAVVWAAPADGNWSVASNWSPARVPGLTDQVFFNNTSTSNCTMNIATTVASVVIQSSFTPGSLTVLSTATLNTTGDFSQAGGFFSLQSSVMGVGGNWTNSGGAFAAGSSTVTFNGAGAFNITSGGTLFNNVVFNNSVSTWTLSDAFATGPNAGFGLLSVLGGTFSSGNNYSLVTGPVKIKGTGVFSLNASTMVVMGNWINNGGHFSGGTSTVTLEEAGLIQSSGQSFNTLIVVPSPLNAGGTATTQLFDPLSLTGNLFVQSTAVRGATLQSASQGIAVGNSVQMSGSGGQIGSLQVANAVMAVSGNFSLLAGGNFLTANSTVTFTGASTSTSTITGSIAFTDLVCTTPGKTLFFQGNSTQTVSNLLTLTGASGNPVVLRSTSTNTQWYLNDVIANNVSFVDVKDSNAGGGMTINASGPSVNSGNNVNWNFIGSGVAWAAPVPGNWSVASNWSPARVPGLADQVFFNNTSTSNCTMDIATTVASVAIQLTYGAGTLTVLSTATLSMTGDFSQAGGFFNLQASTMGVGGNWTNSGGTFNAGTSTVTFNGAGAFNITSGGNTFNDVVFGNLVSTWTLSDAFNVQQMVLSAGTFDTGSNQSFVNNGNMIINGGTLNMNSSAFSLSGAWTNTGGTVNPGASTADFNGFGIPGPITSHGQSFFNFTIDDASYTLGDAFSVNGSLKIRSNVGGSSLDTTAGNYSITASSDVLISGGSITQALLKLNASTMSVVGNWTLTNAKSVVNAGTSTVTFSGASTSTSTLSGSATFYSLTCVTPGKTLFFQGNSTQTVSNLLTLTGSLGNLVVLRSTSTNTQWYLNDVTANNVSFVDVKDSNANAGILINAGTTSLDSGNNIHWIFNGTPPAAVTDLSALTGTVPATINLTWTAPGANGSVGTLNNSTFTIQASTVATTIFSTTTVPSNAFNVTIATTGVNPGDRQAYALGGLISGATYYIRLWTINGSGVSSGLSNGATAYAQIGKAWARLSASSPNWSNPNNWAPVGVPGAADNVVFTNLSTQTCTMDISTTAASLTVQSVYSGTITALSTATLSLSGNIFLAGGTFNLQGSVMDVGGSWTNTGGTFNAGTSTVTFNGAGSSTIVANNQSFNHLVINGAGGTWDLGGTLPIGGSLTVANGTLNTGGGNFAVSVTSDVILNNGTFELNNSSMSVAGNWVMSGIVSFIPDGSTVTFTASAAKTITSNGQSFNNVQFNGSGSWIFNDSFFGLGDLSMTNGTVSTGPGNSGVTFSQNVNLNGGTLNLNASQMTVSGNWIRNAGAFNAGTSTVTFNSAGQKTITSGGQPFYNAEFDASLGIDIAKLLDPLTVSNLLTVTQGIFDTNAAGNYAVTLGTAVIAGGEFKARSSSVTVQGNWDMGGGLFTAGTSSVTFQGTSTSTSTLAGSTTFYNFVCATPGETLIFAQGSTQTVAGLFSLSGGIGNPIFLRSSSATKQWFLANTGTNSVSSVNVMDSNANPGNLIVAFGNSFDAGDNLHWNFNGAGVTWAAPTPGNWSVASNWQPQRVPGASDKVFFNASSTSPCTVDITTTVTSIQISPAFSPGTITVLNSVSLGTSGDFDPGGGTFNLQGAALAVGGNWANTGGAFHAGTSTVTFNGTAARTITSGNQSFNHLVFNGAGGDWILQDNLAATGNLNLMNGTFDTNAGSNFNVTVTSDVVLAGSGAILIFNGSAVSVGGNWANLSGAFNAGASTVTFTGTASQSITSGGTAFKNILFNGAGRTWTLQDDLSVGGILTLTAGTLDTQAGVSNAVSVTSALVINGGTFTARASIISVKGNWSLTGGSFDAGTSGTSIVNFSGLSGSTSTLTGSTTFYQLRCVTAGKWLEFQPGATTTVTNLFRLTGASGNPIVLRSLTNGSTWYLNNASATGSNQVSLVDVKDSNASAGLLIRAGAASFNSGNNTHWTFTGDTIPPASVNDLSALTSVISGRIDLTWTAPGNDGSSGTLVAGSSFTIQYTTVPNSVFDPVVPPPNSFTVNIPTANVNPGDFQAYSLAGLTGGATYFIRLWTSDDSGNISDISNGATTWAQIGRTWAASAPGSWSVAANWEPAGAPGPADVVFFNQRSVQNSTVDITTTVASLRISPAYSPGTISVNSGLNLSINGSYSQSGGTFNAGASTLTVGGDWALNAGTFTANTSTVVFSGAPGSTSTFSGSTTFSSLFCASPGKLLFFTANSTQTVSGVLTLAGALGQRVFVRSSPQGSYGYLVNTGTNTVTFTDAQDSNASGGVPIVVDDGSLNSGHNVNWQFDTTPPPAITDLSALTGSVTGTINLTWTATGDDGFDLENATFTVEGTTVSPPAFDPVSPPANTIRVQISTDNVPVGNVQGYTFSGLTQGATYFVRIWTTDDSGNISSISNGATAQASVAVPPTNLTLSLPDATSYDKIQLDWTNPGAPQLSTRVERSPDGASFAFVSSVTLPTSTYIDSGLSPNTSYYYRIFAIYLTGLSPSTTAQVLATRSAPPTSVTAVSVFASSATVTWNANGNPSDTLYTMNASGVINVSSSTLLTQATVTGLAINQNYLFGVLSQNRAGLQTGLVSTSSTTLSATPVQPTVTGNFSVANGFYTQITINPDGNPGDNLYAILFSSAVGDPTPSGYLNGGGGLGASPTWLTITGSPGWATGGVNTGLVGGATYYYQVIAKNRVGILTDFSPSGFARVPSLQTPSNLTVTTRTVVTLSWQWQDNATLSDSFLLGDGNGCSYGSIPTSSPPPHAAGGLYSFVQSQLCPTGALIANTTYTFSVAANSSSSGPGVAITSTAFTTALSPDVTTSASTTTVNLISTFTFTNVLGFGQGSLAYYRYTWNFLPTDPSVFTSPTIWSSGQLIQHAPFNGSINYLHVVSFNGDNLIGGEADYGPFQFQAPTGAAISAITVNGVVTDRNGLILGVPNNVLPTVSFTNSINASTLGQGITLKAIATNRDDAISPAQAAQFTFVYNDISVNGNPPFTAVLTPSFPIKGYSYELAVTTNVLDAGGNPIQQGQVVDYRILFDRFANNRVVMNVSATPGAPMTPHVVTLDVPPESLPDDGAILISPDRDAARLQLVSSSIQDANARALLDSPYDQNVWTGGFDFYNSSGTIDQRPFSNPLTLTCKFAGLNNGSGYLSNVSIPVRLGTLNVRNLDLNVHRWNRLDGFSVDSNQQTISGPIYHFSVYAVFGAPDTSVEQAYAFPVPFKPSLGHTHITFINLSSEADIKVYTINGELVKGIHHSDAAGTPGQEVWDVTNNSGQPLGSDVFYYLITSQNAKKTGKILVVR